MILPWNTVVTHLQWPSVAVILSARLELVNNDPTLEHFVTHLLWPSVAVILSAHSELVNNDPTLEHCRNTSTMAFCGSDSVSSFRASEQCWKASSY